MKLLRFRLGSSDSIISPMGGNESKPRQTQVVVQKEIVLPNSNFEPGPDFNPLGLMNPKDPIAALAMLATLETMKNDLENMKKGLENRTPAKGKSAPPAEGKSLKEILPYSAGFQQFIDNYIKYDITDDIPDLHNPQADFYEGVGFNKPGGPGQYTGWVVNSQPNGRGSWVDLLGKIRIDGIWKDGDLHGIGRIIWIRKSPQEAWQGFFESAGTCHGADKFLQDGTRLKWNEVVREWRPVA